MPENIPVANVVVFPTAIPVAYLVDRSKTKTQAKLERTVSLTVRKTFKVMGVEVEKWADILLMAKIFLAGLWTLKKLDDLD